MINRVIRIATRQSPLALWQAEFVKTKLQTAYPQLQVELLPMTTRGDKILDSPLAKIGGKGLFIKELEVALLDGSADIAVHSMKDVPMEFPEGLGLSAICEREDYHDAFVSGRFQSFSDLPEGAVVGSSSLRRQCQLRAVRPDIRIRDLRGNVNTRLSRLDDGDYDAIILAAAGLKRLGLQDRIREKLDTGICLPAGGQGAVGIESRLEDAELTMLLKVLNHSETAICVNAERAMNARLHGGCQVPIASLAKLDSGTLSLQGIVGAINGEEILSASLSDTADSFENLGIAVAEKLLEQGAQRLLDQVNDG